MLVKMWQTWYRQEDRSKSWDMQQWQLNVSNSSTSDIQQTGGRRPWPLAHRHISDIAQFFRQIPGCCAVQSSADEDCQFELDTLRSTSPMSPFTYCTCLHRNICRWELSDLVCCSVCSESVWSRSRRWLAGLCMRWVDLFRSAKFSWWLGSRVVSVLDSGAEGPGFKSQPRRCRVTVLGKLFTPIVPLFTKQRNW